MKQVNDDPLTWSVQHTISERRRGAFGTVQATHTNFLFANKATTRGGGAWQAPTPPTHSPASSLRQEGVKPNTIAEVGCTKSLDGACAGRPRLELNRGSNLREAFYDLG